LDTVDPTAATSQDATVVAQKVGWVLLAYRVPRVPSTPRIAIWRKLRSLGVAQVGDGLVALPEDARTREQLEWIAADVDAAGGSAIVWRAELLSARDEQRLVAQLAAARTGEYRAIIDRAEQARHDRAADPAADPRRLLTHLRRELRRVRRRDHFPPPEAELARRAVEDLALPPVPAHTGPAIGQAG
jgi:hypothetical protein